MSKQNIMLALSVSLLVSTAACSDSLNFMVIGDWGGAPTWPYYTPGEKSVAKSLGRLAGEVNAPFTIALGDNFYQAGVKNVEDPRFEQTFENVFTSPNLQAPRHDFRVLAGNHDHYGNVSAQVLYSEVSKRWHFPSLWYDFVEHAPDGASVHVVMIDTVGLSGNSQGPDGRELDGSDLPGPADVGAAEAQWAWINRTVHDSTASYLLVAGHFPVYSVCEHGPTKILLDRLKPMLLSARATAYLGGHDHCAEALFDEGIAHHGIGASHECVANFSHVDDVPAGSLKWHYDAGPLGEKKGAYAHVAASRQGLVVRHIASSGDVLYTAPAQAPRA
jgi:tartrate-resistant acid phosphatase type 5